MVVVEHGRGSATAYAAGVVGSRGHKNRLILILFALLVVVVTLASGQPTQVAQQNPAYAGADGK